MDVDQALEVDSLSHAFGTNRVLNGIFLRCVPGEIIGIVGRNGCGKTTMLRSIFGELDADAMHLRIDGQVVTNAFRTGEIGYLFQEPFLPRRLSVRKAVRGLLSGERADAVLRNERIRPHLRRRVGSLSGGEQRFLEVLLIVSLPVRYIFLDEPFTEIEPVHREPLKQIIRAASHGAPPHDARKGVLITDHAYHDILDTADRVRVLADGVLREASGEADLKRWGYTP